MCESLGTYNVSAGENRATQKICSLWGSNSRPLDCVITWLLINMRPTLYQLSQGSLVESTKCYHIDGREGSSTSQSFKCLNSILSCTPRQVGLSAFWPRSNMYNNITAQPSYPTTSTTNKIKYKKTPRPRYQKNRRLMLNDYPIRQREIIKA